MMCWAKMEKTSFTVRNQKYQLCVFALPGSSVSSPYADHLCVCWANKMRRMFFPHDIIVGELEPGGGVRFEFIHNTITSKIALCL